MTFEEAKVKTAEYRIEKICKMFDSAQKTKVIDEMKQKICSRILCKFCIMNDKCHSVSDLNKLTKDELISVIDRSGVKIKAKKYWD